MTRSQVATFGRIAIGVVLVGLGGMSWAQVTSESVSNVLVGRVFQQDGTTFVPGATVRAYHLDSGRLFSTASSWETGSYILMGLPDGSYDIRVETPDGNFMAPEIVNLGGGTRALMSFTLSPGELPSGVQDRMRQRGLEPTEAKGLAKVLREKSGKPMWGKGGGVAAIVLGSIAGGIVLEEALDDKDGSPSGP